MPNYELEVEGEAREVYTVQAADEAEARAIFERGDAGKPLVTEVGGCAVVSVTEEGDS